MNVAAANCAAVDHARVVVFPVIHRVVLLVVPDIPPLRVHLIGANAVPIIQETVLLGATSAVTVVRHRALGILLRPVFKRF
ncbi:MAG: hypothetical protein EXS20_02760 [Opitutales bacterium]|nr:hypothetical protein [Opitutales bacterium]